MYVLSFFCINVNYDEHTIRIMFKCNIKYAILLYKLRNGENLISLLIWIHNIQGVG